MIPSSGITIRIAGPEGASLRQFPPHTHELVVGRDESCGLVLAGDAISRKHFTLRFVGNGVTLEDTSANGTFVGEAHVCRSLIDLDPGKAIRLGGFELLIASPLKVESELPSVVVSDPVIVSAPQVQPSAAPRAPARVSAEVRRKLHKSLVDHLDLLKLERSRLNPLLLRAKVELALKDIVSKHQHLIPAGTNDNELIRDLANEAVGLGPLEALLADDSVTEIMVVDPSTIYIEQGGKMFQTDARFTDHDSLRSTLERIVMPLGRRIDESAPMLDARLPDGSRVNAIIPPLATRGPCITIRKFSRVPLTMQSLIDFGSIDERMSRFLIRSVQARKNIIVAGGTGSGKTTLLNILSGSCSATDRIVTIEDSAELKLQQSHVVTLEARPPNMEGKGEVSIRDLVKNAMRMRPDRIIVGECRGGEALDMLLAMNTGHEGSMTTTHANSPVEALRRIESLALMSGVDLPAHTIREQIASAVDLLVHQTRFSDGSRRITSITEVIGLSDGMIETRDIFGYRRDTTSGSGEIQGHFYATGYLPSYLAEFIALGVVTEGEVYL